jgi:DNA-binding transcriptional LysR family regulator
MIEEALFDDLDVLDYLELLNSTVRASEALGMSQSSCSRRYRALSSNLDVEFDRVDGAYMPQQNLDVLSALREAAQKLRVRRQQLRLTAAWAYGPLTPPAGWRQLPILAMSTSHLLSLLDGRLLDLWIGGLLECQPLLEAPLELLTARRLQLGQSLQCLPLFRWPLQLLAHRDHPIRQRRHLSPDDLARHPSPALPLGAAPLLNRALQGHGLATCPYAGTDYDPERWEGVARDGHSLAYAPPQRLVELEHRWQLQALPYDLGITDVAAVIGHRDVLGDPAFATAIKDLLAVLRATPLGRCSQIQWLL